LSFWDYGGGALASSSMTSALSSNISYYWSRFTDWIF